jgi:hypothetical protein
MFADAWFFTPLPPPHWTDAKAQGITLLSQQLIEPAIFWAGHERCQKAGIGLVTFFRIW